MKKIIALLLVLLLTGCGAGGGGSGSSSSTTPYTPLNYDITEEEYNMSDELQWRSVNSYDHENYFKVVHSDCVTYFLTPTENHLVDYHYYANGLMQKMRMYTTGNETLEERDYILNGEDKIGEEYYYSDGNPQAYRKIIRTWDGNNATANSYSWVGSWDNQTYYIEKYDVSSNLLQSHFYLIDDTLVSSTNYIYSQGKIDQYTQYVISSGQTTLVDYTYNAELDPIATDTFVNSIQTAYRTYSGREY